MDGAKVTVVEEITFLKGGGSRHVWTWPSGTSTIEEFAVSPVLVRLAGSWGYAAPPPNLRGITRRVEMFADEAAALTPSA